MSCHEGNVLEEISAKLYPRIYDIKADLLEAVQSCTDEQ